MSTTNNERADFEAWLGPTWSRDTFADDDGDTLYVEDWVQGAWMMFCHNRASLAAKAPAAPTGWYALSAEGIATLCASREDAEQTAADSNVLWPNCGPFRAVQLYTAPPAPTEQWRDIETAPRDGTEVLLWREDCGQFIGRYTSCDAFPLTQDEIDATDEETLFAKDWFTQWPQALRLEGSEVPTRWRHLPDDPAPPQGAAKGATT